MSSFNIGVFFGVLIGMILVITPAFFSGIIEIKIDNKANLESCQKELKAMTDAKTPLCPEVKCGSWVGDLVSIVFLIVLMVVVLKASDILSKNKTK